MVHPTRLRSALVAALAVVSLLYISPAKARAPWADEPLPLPALSPVSSPDLTTTPARKALAKVLARLAGERSSLTSKDFAPDFLKSVPFPTFEAISEQVRNESGPFTLTSIVDGETPQALVARLHSGQGKHARLRIGLDAENRFTALLIQPDLDALAPPLTSFDDLHKRLAAIPGQSAVLLAQLPDDTDPQGKILPIFEHHPDRSLAIGSAFKLWILAAMAESIEEGLIKWTEPLSIDPRYRSLPSGVMQNEPDQTLFPVFEFASKMISISDNTATDHLLARVGRDRVEKFMAAFTADGQRNLPLVSTRELFILKLNPQTDLAERYRAADQLGRQALLQGEIASSQPMLLAAAFWRKPRYIDSLEWFASPADLAKVLQHLRIQMAKPPLAPLKDVLTMNPGLPLNAADWPLIAFKGGSEPGVLNLSFLLRRKDDRWYVAIFTFNNTAAAYDDSGPTNLAQRAIEFLAQQPAIPPAAPLPTTAPPGD